MSRLIVKGLPYELEEQKLKDHFSKQGAVTDVKLMKKRNGESRRFAFIGYKNLSDAESAVRYFNKSFIDTFRIDVELAKTFSDPTVPLPKKQQRRLAEQRLQEQEERYLEQEDDRKIKKQKNQKSSIDLEIENNPKLREFMEVMKPSHQVKSWANDDIADGSGAPSTKALEEALNGKSGSSKQVDTLQLQENASDDEYEDFVKKDDEPQEEEEEQMMSLSDLPVVDDGSAANENVTDLDWLKSRRTRIRDVQKNEETAGASKSDEASKQESNETYNETPEFVEEIIPEVRETEEEKNASKIQETGRLFIRNILYTSTEDDFRELFSPYGGLEEVHIAIDTRTGKSKGFVYVQFNDADDAVRAFYELDKQIFQGRLLHILPGQAKKDHRLDEFDLKNLPLKKQKELKRKAEANKSQFSWNSLFMNNDAVLSSVAAKMGVSKNQLIDPENSSSAVKQALAEAHVIGDVRKYFESKGIDLTSFDKKERDDKVILVKNFPFGTTIEEIGELFAEYGELKRMLMPPAGTIAIVEFRDIPSARAAFTKLSYRRFKKSIVYLEKGPKDLFTREPEANETVDVSSKKEEEEGKEAAVSAKDVLENSAEEEEDAIEGPTVSIFVKNLNFKTTALQLSEAFKPFSGFAVATVKTKPDPKKDGAILSMGFGFVEFKTKEQANAAISVMDGNVLDGHKLQLKLSHRQGTTSNNKNVDKSKKSSKIIVKNLPFEASRKDILDLFSSFGQLKSVRVPKKMDKSARGFAFVEFVLLKEAENAMDQLQGVHLLGRRLVMQFAEQASEDVEEEIEKMTKKVKRQQATTQLNAARLTGKRKLDMGEEDAFAGL